MAETGFSRRLTIHPCKQPATVNEAKHKGVVKYLEAKQEKDRGERHGRIASGDSGKQTYENICRS